MLGTLRRSELARLRRRRVGYVFQDLNLLASLTAAENVTLPLELDGLSPRKARELAERALDEVGLAEIRRSATPTRCPAASSSGWRSRGRSSATGG